MNPSSPLVVAQDAATYKNSTLTTEQAKQIVQNGLKLCVAPDLGDIRNIFQALGRGPFLCSTAGFHPHPHQRPIDEKPIDKLTASLAGADQRTKHPMLVLVDTSFWEAHPSPSSTTPEPLETVGCAPGFPLIFSHGHRLYALKRALESSRPEHAQWKRSITQIYGETMDWVVYFLPSCKCMELIMYLSFYL